MPIAPRPAFVLSATPLGTGRLIEQCFYLWLASWRANVGYGLLYGVASLLPALTLGELSSHVMRATLALGADSFLPWLPRPMRGDPAELFVAIGAWLQSPLTWFLIAVSLLGVLVSVSLIIDSQARIARADTAGSRDLAARLPAGIGAWLIYAAVCLLLCLPIVAVSWAAFLIALGVVDLGSLLILLLAYLLGAALASVPLVWGSVAFGFAPFAAMMDDDVGALASQRRSAQRVRGHWVHSALVLTVPVLIYLGVSSTLASFTLVIAAALAFSWGGWMAIFDGSWLLWSQLAAAIFTAASLPLATAGGVLGWHDLGLRVKTTE